MSEFGRTVKENGNGGTDHGHGNVMWAVGGKVRSGIMAIGVGWQQISFTRGAMYP